MNSSDQIELSIIVPVTERYRDVIAAHRAYASVLETVGLTIEYIYVMDGYKPDTLSELREEARDMDGVMRVLQLTKDFGEAAALTAGFNSARGGLILTLPSYLQIMPERLPELFEAIAGQDLVVARRSPRIDHRINRLQSGVFHAVLNVITGTGFHDLGCGVRLMRRRVVDEVAIYGDQHRFLPVLADRAGFRVIELPLPQSEHDRHRRTYRPGVYPRRLLDILTVFFLVKFTRKPLRFFGLVGIGTASLGAIWILWLVFERLVLHVPLGDRPALLLSSLMLVLGVQVFAMGLLGELLIFTHARDIKEYAIEEIINEPHSAQTARQLGKVSS